MRSRFAVAIALAGFVALGFVTLGMAGCGSATPGQGVAEDLTDLTWEQQALESIGYTVDDLGSIESADVTPSATADRDGRKDRRPHRFKRLRMFGKHVLHGEAVVQTEEGTKTVVVQRGKVTAVDATSVTVTSTDGFVLVWKVGNPVHVIKERRKSDLAAVTVGATVGVAGAKDGDTPVARLIVVPKT